MPRDVCFAAVTKIDVGLRTDHSESEEKGMAAPLPPEVAKILAHRAFYTYDGSSGAAPRFVFHTAFDDGAAAEAPPRRSIECRCLVIH